MDKKVKGEIIKSGNIVLSGFMGSGKTTVGRRLAAALDMQFVDMDLYIEKKTGMTVKEIFAEYGELHFRALETETVKELAQSNHSVIATGGGTLMQPQNVEGFHQGGGTIYYLGVPLAALQERLKNDKRRPLLQTPDRDIDEYLIPPEIPRKRGRHRRRRRAHGCRCRAHLRPARRAY